MKIRDGFVSNSSSSSFIVATKGIGENDIVIFLEELFAVPENFPIKNLTEQISKCFISNMRSMPLKEYINYYDPDEDDKWLELFKNGWTLYRGSFSNEVDDPIEYLLVDTDILYTSDRLIIEHYGGF